MVVGIEINDKNYSKLNFSIPEKGNPGMGGADYMLLLLATSLQKKDNGIEVIVFHNGDNKTFYKRIQVKTLSCDYREVVENKVDVYIANGYKRDDKWFDFFERNNIRLIIREANYPLKEKLKQYHKYKCIKRFVFLTGQEYDWYLDDDIIERSCIIENMHIPSNTKRDENACNNEIVTYMGALVPQKGFHFLAKYWREVLAEVPNAKLYVLGSGKLYNENTTLGLYGIAEKEYENLFMKYLTGEDGKILKSVHFFGVVGEEKKNILKKTSVGVPNPIGTTETFCNCAVEMEDYGIPVVTIKKYSFPDVVQNKKGGLLYRRERDFVKYLVQLLKDKEKNYIFGERARHFADRFSVENVLPIWEKVIWEVIKDKDAAYLGIHGHIFNNKKYIQIINRFLRFKLKMRFLPSRLGR